MASGGRVVQKFRAFLFDVDNTVTSDLMPVGDGMAAALLALPGEVGFVSGTDAAELRRMVSSRLPRRHHLLANTGTHYVVVDGASEREVLRAELGPDRKREVVAAMRRLKAAEGLEPMTSEADQILDRGSQVTLSILGRHAPPESKEAYDPDRGKRERLVGILRQWLDPATYKVAVGGTTSIDVTLAGSDKASAVRLFARETGIPAREVAFFGDQLRPGGNDHAARSSGAFCVEVRDPADTLRRLEEVSGGHRDRQGPPGDGTGRDGEW